MDPNYFLTHLYFSSASSGKDVLQKQSVKRGGRGNLRSSESTYSAGFLGYALAKAGGEAEARSLFRWSIQEGGRGNISGYHIASFTRA